MELSPPRPRLPSGPWAFAGWTLSLFLSSSAFGLEPIVLITSPTVLRQLEDRGNSFGERLAGASFAGASNARLYAATPMRDIVDRMARDLDEFATADPRLGPGMHKVHRLFDIDWLKSPDAHFELVGVSNRLDRRPFNQRACGEIRFVYRLAYVTSRKGRTIASRLPMTINVVNWAFDEKGGLDCPSLANRWISPVHFNESNLAPWLSSLQGPLAPKFLEPARIKSVEINFQSVRWPSTIRGDMAGHAEYVLRNFRFDAKRQHLIPSELENTPDVERIASDSTLRARLLAWFKESGHLKLIDDGIAVLPKEFLAKRAVSVAPRGMARLANRPFSRLFTVNDLDGMDLNNRKTIGSPAALLLRLNDLSCMGCHQARSVAGFHLLGRDSGIVSANALAVAMSPHLAEDLDRRRAYVRRLASGALPSDARPLSEHASSEGYFGAHCGRGDPGFKAWTCREGLECQPNPDDESDLVGRCFPKLAAVGAPCELGTVVKNEDSHRDTVKLRSTDCDPKASCETNFVGFPGGMCATSCDETGKDGVCGGIAQLVPFNACLARNKPFEECLANHVSPAGLRACGETIPCRDDYICAWTASGEGACIPPYFIFQMRVDGHPKASL